MERDEALQGLNELFAEELEAGMRYLHLAATVTGVDRILVRQTLIDNMEETIEHAQLVAGKILQLGGVPKLELKLSLPGVKTTGNEALKNALAFEQAALDAYRDLLAKVGPDDIVMEEFLRSQVALESEHVAELRLLLE